MIRYERIMHRLESEFSMACGPIINLILFSLNRAWPKQKTNSRIIFVKRAQVYHSGRMYMNTLYRRRSELDDNIINNLADFAVSTYTRIRR
jgi:hypothetical protein